MVKAAMRASLFRRAEGGSGGKANSIVCQAVRITDGPERRHAAGLGRSERVNRQHAGTPTSLAGRSLGTPAWVETDVGCGWAALEDMRAKESGAWLTSVVRLNAACMAIIASLCLLFSLGHGAAENLYS